MHKYLFAILILISSRTANAAGSDTIKIYFEIGIPQLDKAARHTIDSVIYNDILIAGKKQGIVGYADYLGTEQANMGLSEARAKNVQSYLEAMGIHKEDIQMVIGKGQIERAVKNGSLGYKEDRRVDIVIGGLKDIPKPVAVKPALTTKTEKIIDIAKAKANETIRLDNLYFEPGSHKIRDISLPELNKLYITLKDHPTVAIQIEGHICCAGNNSFDGYDYDSEDFHLSENRARAIYDYLIERGINKVLLKYVGLGKSRPLVDPEQTEDDENRNRRVEIRILAK